jgi:hypothetical protein
MSQIIDLMRSIDDRLASIDRELGEQGKKISCLEGKMKIIKWAILAVPSVVGALIGAAAATVALLV